MNMKKFLLLVLLATVVSTKVFAGFALGVKGGVNVNNMALWHIGPSIGFGNMKGSPFIIDVLMYGKHNTFSIEPNFDWHVLTWNIAIMQLYLGLGVGTQFSFATNNDSTNPFDFVLAARIPVGLKVFLSAVELFAEISPQLGWLSYSFNSNGSRQYQNSFYWAIGFDLGLRIWW